MSYSSQNIHGKKQIRIRLGDFTENIKIDSVNEIRGFKISETAKNLFGKFFANFGAELYLIQHIDVVAVLRSYSLYHAKFKTGQNITISNRSGRYMLYFDYNPDKFLFTSFNNYILNSDKILEGEIKILNFFANTYLKNIYNETNQPEILEYVNRINKKIFLEV